MNKKFWKKKKVLVTGHEGFLGSWLARQLIEVQADVIGLDRVARKSLSVLDGFRNSFRGIQGDVRDLRFVKKIITRHKPAVVFHLAAEALVGRAYQKPVEAFGSNIQGTWNILEASRGKAFVAALVVASSDKAYGSHVDLPYTESTQLNGKFPYDVSKSCADLLAQAYYHTYKVPVCVTRCGNIYGPGDLNFSRLVPDAMRCMLNGRRFQIRSNGHFTRDYVYVEDIARACILLAEKMVRSQLYGEAFNFSNEEPLTVMRLVREISRVSGEHRLKFTILNKAGNEIRHQYLSSKKAQRLLGWRPLYSLEEGLRKTLDWYSRILK